MTGTGPEIGRSSEDSLKEAKERQKYDGERLTLRRDVEEKYLRSMNTLAKVEDESNSTCERNFNNMNARLHLIQSELGSGKGFEELVTGLANFDAENGLTKAPAFIEKILNACAPIPSYGDPPEGSVLRRTIVRSFDKEKDRVQYSVYHVDVNTIRTYRHSLERMIHVLPINETCRARLVQLDRHLEALLYLDRTMVVDAAFNDAWRTMHERNYTNRALGTMGSALLFVGAGLGAAISGVNLLAHKGQGKTPFAYFCGLGALAVPSVRRNVIGSICGKGGPAAAKELEDAINKSYLVDFMKKYDVQGSEAWEKFFGSVFGEKKADPVTLGKILLKIDEAKTGTVGAKEEAITLVDRMIDPKEDLQANASIKKMITNGELQKFIESVKSVSKAVAKAMAADGPTS